MKTLEQACQEARLRAIVEFGKIPEPDLSTDGTANEHQSRMQRLFAAMNEAEAKVRATWREPPRKFKDQV